MHHRCGWPRLGDSILWGGAFSFGFGVRAHVAAVLAVLLGLGGPAAVRGQCAPGFNDEGNDLCRAILVSTGDLQTVTLPLCADEIRATVSGAAGGTSFEEQWGASSPGGTGGRVSATIPIVAGDTLTVVVGQAGADGVISPSGYGGYGGGGHAASRYGGSGGGGSFIFGTDRLLVAAGGGGGGGFDWNPTASHSGNQQAPGGDGSGIGPAGDGQSVAFLYDPGGGTHYPPGGGGGATPDGPGAGGDPSPASPAFGTSVGETGWGPATDWNYIPSLLGKGGDTYGSNQCGTLGFGGGGGGGYYGGGGGGSISCDLEGGGGGGGSGYVIPEATSVTSWTGVQIEDGEVVIDYTACTGGAPATRTTTSTATSTVTETGTATDTPSGTPTDTATDTPTDTPTATPSSTQTAADTATGSATDTATDTPSQTMTATESPTAVPATSTPTPTPTATIYISGHILHYNNANPVAVVSVEGEVSFGGPVLATATTDAAGSFRMTGIPAGPWALQPHLTDTHTSVWRGVSTLDATWIQEHMVGSRWLDANRVLAGDTTGNGALSTLDATRIQEWRVGNIARLPVSANCNSDWAFVPAPGPAGNPTPLPPHIPTPCTVGGISYASLAGSADGQDFQAILFGDVTGNWTPPSGASTAMEATTWGAAGAGDALASDAASLAAPPECEGPCAGAVTELARPTRVVIAADRLEDVQAFDLALELPAGVGVEAVRLGELAGSAGDCSLVWAAADDAVRISLGCLTPIRGGGALASVELRGSGAGAMLSSCVFDERGDFCRRKDRD